MFFRFWFTCLLSISSDLGNITASIKGIFHEKSFLQSTTDIPEDSTFGILLDKTSFYAESGGQEYDTGNIVIDGIADFEVENVQVYNGYVLHTGHLKYGHLNLGDEVVSSYDEVRILLVTFPFSYVSLASPMAFAQQSHRYAHPQLWLAGSPWRPY